MANVSVQFADGLASSGCSVEVVVPRVFRKDNIQRDQIFNYYGIEQSFRIRELKTFIYQKSFKHYILIMLMIHHFVFAMKLLFNRIKTKQNEQVIIISTLGYILLPYFIVFKSLIKDRMTKLITWEHEFHERKKEIWIYGKCDGILVTNSEIKKTLTVKYKVPSDKIFVTLNPISEKRLSNILDREKIRRELGIARGQITIVYTGKLSTENREVKYIIEAAALLPEYSFILTGGKPNVIKYFKEYLDNTKIKNVQLTGFLYKFDDLKYYQIAADILVSYYSKHDLDVRYNLPAKIGEYLTTKNPIVTVDHPATRDILNSSNVLFVEPDNPGALAEGIKKLVENKKIGNELALNAFKSALGITYRRTAEKTLDFLSGLGLQ